MAERGGGAACERGGRKLFSLGFRGRGGRSRGAGCCDEEEKWVPATKLGRLVKDGKISSLEQIYLPAILGRSNSLTQNHLASAFSLKNKDDRSLLHVVVSTGKSLVRRLQYSSVSRFSAEKIFSTSEFTILGFMESGGKVERQPYVKEVEKIDEAYQKALLKESDDGLKVDDEADSVNTTGNNISEV